MNDYERIAQAISYINEHFREQPDLATIAAQVGLSEYHFQRLFQRWAGISPKRFLQVLSAEYARELLTQDHSVMDAAYATGLSGPGRLHDLTVNIHALTPGEIRARGEGLHIRYGLHDTPFGPGFIATTARGICAMQFVDMDADEQIEALRQEWPLAEISQDEAATQAIIAQIFGQAPQAERSSLHVWVQGTNFQVRVWEALLNIPPGQVATYQQIAEQIQMPGAARAVGGAVGRNPIAFLIPCHRVIRASGQFGGYRWGKVRKQAMFAWEAAQHEGIQQAG